MGVPSSRGSSSGEEDGDAKWKAAIDSVAKTSSFISSFTNGHSASSIIAADNTKDDDFDHKHIIHGQQPKHYQIKAQKLLENILEKSLEIVTEDPVCVPDDDSLISESGIRLFKRAPPGIVFDHVDELEGPKKRPSLIPGKEINEKSKKFTRKLRTIAVEGEDILAAAEKAHQKSLLRMEAKDALDKAKAKREEERVAELKKIRGEKWLPSIARKMKLGF